MSQQVASGLVEQMDRHQVVIYLAAMAAGGLLGWLVSAAGSLLQHAINRDCTKNGSVSHSVVTECAAIREGCGGEIG
ncbi:hypothetical protein [Actinacidiphila glaucinigra]|uniref:hypothetical protein n=1 Tax=Actinacidiphila glaucinigra TaxID=235986 RepID=UPI00371A20E7